MVPIVDGPDDYSMYMPSNKSIIRADDFENPKALAGVSMLASLEILLGVCLIIMQNICWNSTATMTSTWSIYRTNLMASILLGASSGGETDGKTAEALNLQNVLTIMALVAARTLGIGDVFVGLHKSGCESKTFM